MKKILLGLVIALMMTGSGCSEEDSLGTLYENPRYSKADKEICKYLLAKAIDRSEDSKDIYKRSQNMFSNEEDYTEALRLQNEVTLEKVKEAHYYAVTWSALCD